MVPATLLILMNFIFIFIISITATQTAAAAAWCCNYNNYHDVGMSKTYDYYSSWRRAKRRRQQQYGHFVSPLQQQGSNLHILSKRELLVSCSSSKISPLLLSSGACVVREEKKREEIRDEIIQTQQDIIVVNHHEPPPTSSTKIIPFKTNSSSRSNLAKSKRLAKQIWSCGYNSDQALHLLFQAYPFLENENDLSKKELSNCSPNENEDILDGKSIATTIKILGKSNRLSDALALLERVCDIYNAILLKQQRITKSDKDDRVVKKKKKLEADVRMIYRACISAAGNCQQYKTAIHLLYHHMPTKTQLVPTLDAYHSLLAACKKCHAVDAVINILTDMEAGKILSTDQPTTEIKVVPPKPDKMVYMTAISTCHQHKNCNQTARLLHRMKRYGLQPDISTYHEVILAYTKVGGRHVDALKLLENIKKDEHVELNNSTYDLVIKCCGKDGAWNEASKLMVERNNRMRVAKNDVDDCGDNDAITTTEESHYADYFDALSSFSKRGKAKDAYWHIGTYYSSNNDDTIEIGIQPHRNPLQNGISLIFVNGTNQEKLGFMLLRHTAAKDNKNADFSSSSNKQLFSAIIGMLVDPKHRGKGLSNIFMAIWLKLCLLINVHPEAEMMKKPLISLALSKFGFVPEQQGGGVALEISPISSVSYDDDEKRLEWEADMALYSPTHQSLQGIYSKRDLRVQRMMIAQDPPNPRGKLIHVKTGFDHLLYVGESETVRRASFCNLERRIKETIGRDDVDGGGDGKKRLDFHADVELLKKAAFGFIRDI